MKRALLLALCLSVPALPVAAQDLPPGLASARLLPGWTDADGNRVAALDLQLLPGWKTYWRSPGDSGLPPSFDWSGSSNIGDVTFHWPTPEAIRSGDALSLGYHDRLVLPVTIRPANPSKPINLSAAVDFGLCERICVPAHLSLRADGPGPAPDPVIEAALDRGPAGALDKPDCKVSAIEDGMQVRVALPGQSTRIAALELPDQPEVWVSSAELVGSNGRTEAVADFVAPSGKPFDLDAGKIRITLIGADGAVEMQGCDPKG